MIRVVPSTKPHEPVDPVEYMRGVLAREVLRASPEHLARVVEALGLDRSVVARRVEAMRAA